MEAESLGNLQAVANAAIGFNEDAGIERLKPAIGKSALFSRIIS